MICDQLTAIARSHSPAWIVLYAGGKNHASVGLSGTTFEIGNPQLADLLAVLDLAAASGPNPGDHGAAVGAG